MYIQKLPSTAATASSAPYDDINWTTIDNIKTDNAQYASITDAAFDDGVYSHLGKASNFGFAIPATATIQAVMVEIEAAAYAGSARYEMVQLLNASGTAEGDNKAATPVALLAHASLVRVDWFGGDLWGVSLTPTMVNDADFGVQFGIKATAADTDIRVDFVRLTVWYDAVYTILDLDSSVAWPAEPYDDEYDVYGQIIPMGDISRSNPTINITSVYSTVGVGGNEPETWMEHEDCVGGAVVPTEGQIWPRGNF